MEEKSYPQKIWDSILDTLFPPRCINCQKEGAHICKECSSRIILKKEQVCPSCERSNTSCGQPCKRCVAKNDTFLDNLLVASSYKDALRRAIYALKYNFIEDLGGELGDILTLFLRTSEIPAPEAIIPVPLHSLRLRFRGFNQSEIIARRIGKNLLPGIEIPVLNSLKRIRWTGSQMKKKKYQERFSNIQDSFSLTDAREIIGRRILLIDDICTTGATLSECAKVLKKGGAKKVSALVLARQEMPASLKL